MRIPLYILLVFVSVTLPCVSRGGDTEWIVYGKAHASIDAIDNGLVDNTNLSNNSTRIGFRGSKELIRDLRAIWQFESALDLSGEEGGLAARNRYVGVEGEIGTIVLGVHDTPFKSIARSVDIFNETVADNRSLLGSLSDGSDSDAIIGDGNDKAFNVRAKNAILYKSPKTNGVQFNALYSSDYTGSGSALIDNQADELSSLSLEYDQGPVMLAVAYEDRHDDEGLRIVGRVKSEQAYISFIYESLSTDLGGTITDRNAYGFNAAYHLGLVSLAIQYIVADKNELAEDSGATLIGVGMFQSLSKSTRVYLAFVDTNNGINAQYNAAGGGHGDKVRPVRLGVEVSAISFGIIHKF